MISVSEAQDLVFALGKAVEAETVPIGDACGRVLAGDVTARRDQPPFNASAMDGYAISSNNAQGETRLRVIGQAAAGHAFDGTLNPGEAVRIFTGAPVPEGADLVVIQEDVTRDGDFIILSQDADFKSNIRPRGGDFKTGDKVEAPRRLSAADITLLAAMNLTHLPVRRKPVIAVLATGDELVMPGDSPGPDQIIASNSFGLKAMFEAAGARVRMLPIARDNAASLRTGFDLADGADIVVTIGGASAGDHDLVADVAGDLGLERSFYKIAMRPGKPLMAGRLRDIIMIGLPGNPVSSMVCGRIFVLPLIDVMLGLPAASPERHSAILTTTLPANGPREHYLRARLSADNITPFTRQDSSLMSVLSAANALIVQPPHDKGKDAGERIEFIHF